MLWRCSSCSLSRCSIGLHARQSRGPLHTLSHARNPEEFIINICPYGRCRRWCAAASGARGTLARGNFLALILSLYGVTHTQAGMHIVHNQRILRRGAVRASERLSGAKSERAQRVACVAPIVSTYTRKEKGLQRKWEVPWRAARRIAGRHIRCVKLLSRGVDGLYSITHCVHLSLLAIFDTNVFPSSTPQNDTGDAKFNHTQETLSANFPELISKPLKKYAPAGAQYIS